MPPFQVLVRARGCEARSARRPPAFGTTVQPGGTLQRRVQVCNKHTKCIIVICSSANGKIVHGRAFAVCLEYCSQGNQCTRRALQRFHRTRIIYISVHDALFWCESRTQVPAKWISGKRPDSLTSEQKVWPAGGDIRSA